MMIKYISLLLVLNLMLSSSKSQNFSISNSVENVLYKGFKNRLNIAIENNPCSSIYVVSDIGEITGDGCDYYYYTKEGYSTNIVVYVKSKEGLKEIGKKFYQIKLAPDPRLLVGPSYGGRLSYRIFKEQDSVSALYENCDFQVRAQVDSFKVKIISSDLSHNKEMKVIGNKINGQLKEIFQLLKPNDTIIFEDIYILGIDNEVRKIKSTTYHLFD